MIEAIQFKEKEYHEDREKYYDFQLNDAANRSEMYFDKTAKDGRFYIRTLEGNMTVSDRDFIIKGIQGEFYPCKPDIFDSTYEEVTASKLRLTVDVVGMEPVQELMKVFLEFTDDTRIPMNVREEFMDKVNDILENR